MRRRAFRSIWISDLHLGSRGCRAGDLERFLHRVDCETLYLVGDVVDFWRLKNRTFWPQAHNEVIRRVLKLAKRGTDVVLVPGNHDEALRQYAGHAFGDVRIEMEAVHDCPDGRRLLVTHGDQFDLVVKHSPLIARVGAAAYESLIVVNRLYNRVRQWWGKDYWSLAQFLKLKVKSACTFVSCFEETLVREAKHRGLDGVVCGHIHHPALDEHEDGFLYLNCGDWVENCTALVEHADGRIEMITLDDLRREPARAHDEDRDDEHRDHDDDDDLDGMQVSWERVVEIEKDWVLVPS